MSQGFRALRRQLITPNVSETKMSTRGFHVKNEESKALLESVGEHFLKGYAYAAEAKHPEEAVEKLEQLPRQFKGFAYEGAGMGFAVLDALPVPGSDRVETFLRTEGGNHVYMVYVGVGWAMARVPRFRWSKLYAGDPLLRWLVLDGYGFHQAYFKTDAYVKNQKFDAGFPWPKDDATGYAARAIDQGVGRALWFVGGTDPNVVADLIDAFPEHRRSDLYGGAGLACTYAGGGDEAELRTFVARAGEHAPLLAQGSAFASEARRKAGLTIPHTELASQVVTGLPHEQAAQITQDVIPASTHVAGGLPAYEVWRQAIAGALVSVGRV